MPRVGQTRKRDMCERSIIDALEAVGAAVFQLSGAGVPDLLISYRGRWVPIECKAKTGTLTPRQVKTRFYAGPVPIARTPAEALQAIGIKP